MLTLFTCPKSFIGEFDVIQRNAIRSWKRLAPSCEIILWGNDFGVAQAARDMEVRHVPEVVTNEFGTPLMHDLFAQAAHVAQNEILGYINADIILLNDFTKAVMDIVDRKRCFLMVGKRWDITVSEFLNFDQFWEDRIRDFILRHGILHTGLDYFVFPRNLWGEIASFAMGRFHWERWFLYAARLRKAMVIDSTPVVMAIHQNHSSPDGVLGGEESKRNWRMVKEASNFTPWDTTHLLTIAGLKARCRSCHPVCACGEDFFLDSLDKTNI